MSRGKNNPVCVVVPTISAGLLREKFLPAWEALFDEHGVRLLVVNDGEHPEVVDYTLGTSWGIEEMGKDADLIYNFNDGVRNLGFAYVAKNLPEVEYIISLDDDVAPLGDTVQDHLDALNRDVPVSWINTTMTDYMRGFPYNIRDEAEVWVSHGLWTKNPDLDGPTQLVNGTRPQDFYRGPIPKGILYPHCAMNFAFKRAALPCVYQAPMGKEVGLDRFGDIWGGVEMKKDLDKLGKAVVSGYALVEHTRASNVYKNLQKEARGIELNDYYGDDEYFKLYFDRRKKWKRFINRSN